MVLSDQQKTGLQRLKIHVFKAGLPIAGKADRGKTVCCARRAVIGRPIAGGEGHRAAVIAAEGKILGLRIDAADDDGAVPVKVERRIGIRKAADRLVRCGTVARAAVCKIHDGAPRGGRAKRQRKKQSEPQEKLRQK